MAGGRPTKYNKQMLDKARDYIQNHALYGDVVPIAAGLAGELGVTKVTLYEWAKHHLEFSNTLQALQEAQERKLTSGGLSNTFQPTIAKLMLANHGYHDKQEVTGADGQPLSMKVEVAFIGKTHKDQD
jgi:hypothetical protein